MKNEGPHRLRNKIPGTVLSHVRRSTPSLLDFMSLFNWKLWLFVKTCIMTQPKQLYFSFFNVFDHYTFFCPETKLFFPYNLGSLSSSPESVFFHHARILQYCQFHGCKVRNCFFKFFEKKYGRYRKSDLS